MFLQIFIYLTLIKYFEATTDFISSVTFYRNRFFICLPQKTPSLYELQWYGPPTATTSKLKPYSKQTTLNTCDVMDMDIRGRLWVLDISTKNENTPQLLMYNLILNVETYVCDLTGISKLATYSLVADPVSSSIFGSRAYLGCADTSEILVCSLKERRYWRLKLGLQNNNLGVLFLSIFARESLLYVSGMFDHHLYTIDLNRLRKLAGPAAIVSHEEPVHMNATDLGNKLGSSSGLFADYKGFIYYYLIPDYAVVRWNKKRPLQAENHDIIIQSAERLPFVTSFFLGPQYTIWAVINSNYTYAENSIFENRVDFDFYQRIIKIGPYL